MYLVVLCADSPVESDRSFAPLTSPSLLQTVHAVVEINLDNKFGGRSDQTEEVAMPRVRPLQFQIQNMLMYCSVVWRISLTLQFQIQNNIEHWTVPFRVNLPDGDYYTYTLEFRVQGAPEHLKIVWTLLSLL